jgi:hypothetical protein
MLKEHPSHILEVDNINDQCGVTEEDKIYVYQ